MEIVQVNVELGITNSASGDEPHKLLQTPLSHLFDQSLLLTKGDNLNEGNSKF